jgi:hypothetical protein
MKWSFGGYLIHHGGNVIVTASHDLQSFDDTMPTHATRFFSFSLVSVTDLNQPTCLKIQDFRIPWPESDHAVGKIGTPATRQPAVGI